MNCVIDFNRHSSLAYLKFQIHQIDSSSRAADEEDLHDGVVERDEAGEEVQVPRDEHHQEQDLRFTGYSGTAPGLPDLQQEQDYCQEMGEISEQSEDIHF